MKKLSVLLICMLVSLHLAAQYYPEGTKWTEIRLDTLKYDSWFSEDGTPNYEVREFYIKGQTETKDYLFNNVYIKRENESDSLAFYVNERVDVTPVISAGAYCSKYPNSVYGPSRFYCFDSYWWSEQRNWIIQPLYMGLIFGWDDNSRFNYTDKEIKEGYFGGEKPLTYVEVPSTIRNRNTRKSNPYGIVYDVCLIQGIGVTSWPGSDCIFGPLQAPESIDMSKSLMNPNLTYHPYRSMLIYFERNGEVLYNMQPTPASVKGVPCPSVKNDTPIYDLSGRQLPQKPTKGIYIQGGKKRLVKDE